jgi:hypothetical protein
MDGELSSREKYTSLAREPPIFAFAIASATLPCRCTHGTTYIDGDVAHDGRVVGQADVPRVVCPFLLALGRREPLVDDEGALHIDADGARAQDGLLNVRVRHERGAARAFVCWSRRAVVCWGGSGSARVRRHGWGSGPWLQACSLAPAVPDSAGALRLQTVQVMGKIVVRRACERRASRVPC